MTAKQFNARHGLSVGSPPIEIINSSGLISSTGIANLDASKITSGTIDAARLPSYVDDVLEAASLAAFPASGETGKIYVALDTNKTYRWSGSTYVYITSGAVDSVAGKTGVITLAKADVGLANVDNTSDANKPVSTATQTALNLKADLASPTFTGTVSGITAAMVGLGNVENKSSATIRGEITSGNVTTALGFTPYNSTNPSAYITAAGARSALSFTAGSGAYNNSTGVITIPTNTNQLTNGAGFITGSGTAANVSGVVAVANGGTGRNTLTANNVILGNGTSAVQQIAPGSSGNVLTSNGTTWVSGAIPSSANEYTATAADTIASAGLPLAINADGTLSSVSVSTVMSSLNSGQFAESISGTGYSFNPAIIYHPTSGRIVVAYYNDTTGFARVKVTSGVLNQDNSITFNTPVELTSIQFTYATGITLINDPTSGNILVALRNGLCCVMSVDASGNVSTGATTNLGQGNLLQTVYLPIPQKFVFAYKNTSNYTVKLRSATISAYTLELGTEFDAGINLGQYSTELYAGVSQGNKLVLSYYTGYASIQSYSINGLSFTSIDFQQVGIFSGSYALPNPIELDSVNGAMLIPYNSGSSGGSIATTTVVFSTDAGISYPDGNRKISFTPGTGYLASTNKYISITKNGSNAEVYEWSYSTSTGYPVRVFAGTIANLSDWGYTLASRYYNFVSYSSGLNKAFFLYCNSDVSFKYATIGSSTSSNYTKFIGFSKASATAESSVTATTLGGINTNASSLVTGSNYYLNENGSITVNNTGIKVGIALSTTKLLVNTSMSGSEINEYLGSLL